MASMYDTIMELPLFKGIGEEQLSAMLEKTSMEFLKFDEGDVVNPSDSKVETVDFILSGRIRQTYQLENFPIAIDEILGKGGLLGALHLFGINTMAPATATALGRVSIMRMQKLQYMNVLQSDNIYLLNFVNFLSAAAQKSPDLFIGIGEASIMRTLKAVAFSIVSRAAETIIVAGKDKDIAEFCGVSLSDFMQWKSIELAHNRIIATGRGIILKSPHLLK